MRRSAKLLTRRQADVLRDAAMLGGAWWPARAIGGSEYSYHSQTLKGLAQRGLLQRARRNTPEATKRNAWLYRIAPKGLALLAEWELPEDHGHTIGGPSPTYKSWKSMHDRCRLPAMGNFESYGGRGVKVCDEWQSFSRFLADMGARPIGTTLDRIDVNGNYEPANCRWATTSQQQNNRRNNRTLTLAGCAMTYAQWERRMGLPPGTIHNRMKAGWTKDRAISEPLKA